MSALAPTHTVEIVQKFRLEAAHFLPHVPEGHRCKRVHGHSYTIEVFVEGQVDPHTGWVIDFYDIEAAVDPVVQRLDHYLLNEVPGLDNPTAENIAMWVWRQVKPGLPELSQIVVHETEMSRAIYRGS